MNAVPCFITRAEDSYAARAERREKALQAAKDHLSAEYTAAACVPLIATVGVPFPGKQHQRTPFLDQFYDQITEPKNRELAARLVCIAMRTEDGKKLVDELAQQHGEYWADDAAGDEE